MKLKILYMCFLSYATSEINRTWWKYTTLYEIYVPTFKDSNGDGIGDLKGVALKLDHFMEIGVESIYITPFYESPMVEGGYDISNFIGVNPTYGTMEDFDELISEAKRRDIKVIIDIVLNHSSNQHPWFLKSIERIPPYTDYYVWKDAKTFDIKGNPLPPNNWISIFGGSAWKWNEKRKQFYLHQFAVQQPDLNLRNPLVKKEIKEIFRFWSDKGVMGFRLDAPNFLIEDDQFRDEPPVPEGSYIPTEYMTLDHIYTVGLWETYEVLHEIREFIDDYCQKFQDYERIFFPESYGEGPSISMYFGKPDYKIAHFSLNFGLTRVFDYENAHFYDDKVNRYIRGIPSGATPSWNLENHDNPRRVPMFSEEYEQLLITCIMMLPGIAYLYYGQEIGMTEIRVREDQKIDKYPDEFSGKLRDAGRLPMQWDDTLNAGFTSNIKPYLPVNPNYWRLNVEALKEQENSRYHLFKKLSDLRKTDTLKYGTFKSYVLSSWIWAFKRALPGHKTYVVVMNLGTESEMVNLKSNIKGLSKKMVVEVAGANSGYLPGDEIQISTHFPGMFMMRPMSVIVLSN